VSPWRRLFGWLGAGRPEAPAAPPMIAAGVPVLAMGDPAPPAITAELLARLGWVAPAAYAEALTPACRRYGIVTPVRLVAFLAQVGHESAGGRYTREIWGPTPAQLRYEGRADLGNHQPGDGKRFLGRGLIQITGRSMYGRCGIGLAQPLEEKPDMLLDPELAALSAGWYWAQAGCNALADANDFDGATKAVNGGLIGMTGRVAALRKCRLVLGRRVR